MPYHGAKPLLRKVTKTVDSLQRIWADGIYEKDGLVEWVHETLKIALDIVKRPPKQKGFVLLPRRWVVERTFAWLGRYRRLSKDYEACTLCFKKRNANKSSVDWRFSTNDARIKLAKLYPVF